VNLIVKLMQDVILLTSFSLVLEKDWLLKSTVKINPTPLLILIIMIILLDHMSSVLLKDLCNFSKIFLISNYFFLVSTN